MAVVEWHEYDKLLALRRRVGLPHPFVSGIFREGEGSVGMVIQFETSFVNKNSAVETITPVKDEDGRWRVSGYFIR